MRVAACLMITAIFAATPALAQWQAQAEAGLVIASGNTDIETVNAKIKLAIARDQWRHILAAATLYASNEDDQIANRWTLWGQSEYTFQPSTFWFGAVRYENDNLGGFEYQATLAGGIGHRFAEAGPTRFAMTTGLGYSRFRTRDAVNEAGLLVEEGDSEAELMLRAAADLDHAVSQTTRLISRILLEVGGINAFAEGEFSVQVKINNVLALALGYALRHNTQPLAGFDETDSLTTMNLIYELK